MKKLKFIGLPVLTVLLIGLLSPFNSCKKEDPCEDEPACDTCSVLYKPNIYIYPEENMNINVELGFPKGGNVIASIPEYGTGWNVSVDTTGLINNSYTYLFYESQQPDLWQKNNGWVIKREELESFFSENMSLYGFKGQEINDFIEYWIPRLNEFEYYAIYPQTKELIDIVVELNISNSPDNLLRLFYLVKGIDQSSVGEIQEPSNIEKFKRDNYFVTEWGVIIE